MNCTILIIAPNKLYDNVKKVAKPATMHCKCPMQEEGLTLPVVALLTELFPGGHKDTRPNTRNQKLARHPTYNICLVSAL